LGVISLLALSISLAPSLAVKVQGAESIIIRNVAGSATEARCDCTKV
jgi:hypothetical protein